MIIDAAGEQSEQGRFLSKSPGSSNKLLGGPPHEDRAPTQRRQRLAILTKRPDQDVRVWDEARALKRSP